MANRKMDRRIFLRGIASAAAGASIGSYSFARSEVDSRPNFVFILTDDLGWADCGCYGHSVHQTPNIDSLAQNGMKFTNAYSASCVCSPTRASILTGKYPARLHLTDWIRSHQRPFNHTDQFSNEHKLISPNWRPNLRQEELTLAESLKRGGYTTACIGKWHLGSDPQFARQVGADPKHGPSGQGFDYEFHREKYSYFTEDGAYVTDVIGDKAADFIERHKNERFFLYLPFYSVHSPLQARKDLLEKYKAKSKSAPQKINPVYAAMLESADTAIGKVLKSLERHSLADNTVVIFTSDNGGNIGSGKFVTTNQPLRAGKGSMYEGGVRVPLIVRFPRGISPETLCDEPVISIDFYPTILQIAGLQGLLSKNIDGMSITGLFKGNKSLDRDCIYWHYPHYHHGGARPYGAVRRGRYKLIEFFEDHTLELYDLQNDIGETNNLAAQKPDIAASLHSKLIHWRREVNAQMPLINEHYAPLTKES